MNELDEIRKSSSNTLKEVIVSPAGTLLRPVYNTVVMRT
jgi:hypothetical protein